MDLPPLKSSMEVPRQPYPFLTLISLPLRPPLPYRPICKPCNWCNKKSGNPYPPHTMQTTLCPHPFKIGDKVLVRRHQIKTLEPRWKGPYTVLLTTLIALKVDRIAAWIHASHVKAAPGRDHEETSEPRWKLHRTQNPLKLRLSRL